MPEKETRVMELDCYFEGGTVIPVIHLLLLK